MRALAILVVTGLLAGAVGCGGGTSTATIAVRIDRFNPQTGTFDPVWGDSAPAGRFRVVATETPSVAITKMLSGNGSGVPGEPRGFDLLPGEATFRVSLPDGRSATRTLLVTENTTPASTTLAGVFNLQ